MATRALPPEESRRQPLNLNTATIEEIADVPLIGPERAEQLMKYRPFDSWDDLGRVPGFEGPLLERLKQGVATVEPPDLGVT